MRQYRAKLKAFSDFYSQSRQFPDEDELAKGNDESHDKYAWRTWPEKMHVTEDGYVKIPGMAIKQAIDAAAKDSGAKIKGRGNKTWGSLFPGGVMVMRDAKTNIKTDEVEPGVYWCDTTGQKGDKSSRRVRRVFPMIPKWEAEVEFVVTNDDIPGEKLHEYLSRAGIQVGIGRFRPSKGGNNGMFLVEKFEEIQ